MPPPDAMTAGNRLAFLRDGGEMGARIRAFDWARSPLGRPVDWPQALMTAAGMLLSTKFAMFIAWGPELRFLYNDACAEILGAQHPAALGHAFQVSRPGICAEDGHLA